MQNTIMQFPGTRGLEFSWPFVTCDFQPNYKFRSEPNTSLPRAV